MGKNSVANLPRTRSLIAFDTNILVYAHREDSKWHLPAVRSIDLLASEKSSWAIPWPCIHEFLSVVTHPKIYRPATPLGNALEQIDIWLESRLELLTETPPYWHSLKSLLQAGRIEGPQVHDARIAALCETYAVSELWTADRDFGKFPKLKIRNPMVG